MRKNISGQIVAFQAISSTDGSDVTTGSPTVYYTIDGGTQAQTTASAVHEGNGQWTVALTQAETNGDHIAFSFVLTGAISQTLNVYTINADITNLDAAISSRSTFDSASDQVTVSTNNDKTGYSISGTKTTLDALNDIAATAIVSGGAITTSGGAVSNVTTVATTTTNTDMRGTDGANTVAPDNASIAAILVDTGTDIPASIAALNNFDPATDQVIVSTNNDKTDYALSSAANDAIGAGFLAYTLTKGSPGTIERAFWQSLKATQLADGEVSGTPTASAFDTNMTAVTGAYDHLLLLFTSGSLAGEARPIDTYSSSNGRITLQEPLTAAPSSSDEFIVVPDHSHPVSEIYEYFVSGSNEDAFKADVSALATQASVDTIDGIVDAIKVKTDELTFTVPGSVDATATADVDEAAIAAAVVAGIGGADVTISSPVASDGTTITIVRGDDYNSADGRSIIWTGATADQWPDLSGSTVVLTAINQNDILRKTLTVTQATGTQQFNMQLTNEETEITSGRYKYDVQATLASGNVITMLVGELIVKKSYAELGA